MKHYNITLICQKQILKQLTQELTDKLILMPMEKKNPTPSSLLSSPP